jgi:amino acid permease
MKVGSSTYTPIVAAVFLLNVFLGTGVLTLPYAFVHAGLVLSAVFLLGIGTIAYITAMFLLEAMAAANALGKRAGEEEEERAGFAAAMESAVPDASRATLSGAELSGVSDGGEAPLAAAEKGSTDVYFNVEERFELGELAALVSNSQGEGKKETLYRRLQELGVYVFLVAYTFGCLATYAVAVVTTLDKIVPWHPAGVDTYHMWLAVFACVVFPFCFGDFQNTRVLQIIVIIVRFAAFGIMVVTSIIFIAQNAPYGRPHSASEGVMDTLALAVGDAAANATAAPTAMPTALPTTSGSPPSMWDRPRSFYVAPAGLSSLFGNTIFTFMFHHSVPGLTTPIRPDKWISLTLLATIVGSVLCYVVLCGAAMFAFEDATAATCTGEHACTVQQLYSLNFQSYHFTWIGKFIQGYPLLMVCLYPLISITLRNNLRRLLALLFEASLGSASAWTQAFRGAQSGAPAATGAGLDSVAAAADASNATPLLAGDGDGSGRGGLSGCIAQLKAQRVEIAVVFAATLLAALPPILLAAVVRNVQQVAHYTGSFAGLFVMLIIPSLLVLSARRRVAADSVLRERNNPLALPRCCGNALPIAILVVAAGFFVFTIVEVVLKVVG